MKLTKPITVMRGLKARPLSSGLVCLDIKDTADPVALKVKRAEAAAMRERIMLTGVKDAKGKK